jgi:DNA-binding CsgD family transcriptional regulator/tetratricopeptide (TPR) repeat protein
VRNVVYVGGPGSGKTAILDDLANTAQAAGALVLRAGGAQAEAQLNFAGLSQLLRPGLADALDLPVQHERVLERALRVGASAEQADPLIAVAVLALFELLSRDQLLVLTIDDMQWVDRGSLDVLAFVARRAANLRIATLAATRELAAGAIPDTSVVELGPLSQADAQALLDAHAGGLDPGLRQAILLKAEGNPLALVELPRAVEGASTDAAIANSLPVTARIQESFASRLDRLPSGGRALLLLAACLESGELAELAAAARAAGIDLAELDQAQQLDLVRIDGQFVRFTHPIIASIVIARAAPRQLREVHGLLAQTLVRQPPRAVRHRAAAATVADEALATELESSVSSLAVPGASVAMAATLERAAFLSEDPTARARRLAAAADASRAAGRYDSAEALLAHIDRSVTDAHTRLSIDSQRGWHLADTGNVDTALGILITVLEEAVGLGPHETIRPAAFAALARWLSGNRSHDAALQQLLHCLDDPVGEPTATLVVMALAAADATRDPAGVVGALQAAAARASAQGASEVDTVATADTRAWELARLADAALAVDAIEPAQALARLASDQLRHMGSFGALAAALATYCHAEFSAGNWVTASEIAQEVLDITAVTGQQREAAFAKASLAYIAAAQGRTTDALQLRQEIVAWAGPRSHRLITALAAWAQLLAALVGGETHLAAQTVSSMRPFAGQAGADDGASHHGGLLVASACADVVEALAREGRLDEAGDVLRWVDARIERWPSPTLAAQATRARAVFADLSDAPHRSIESGYRTAVAASQVCGGFEQARIRLLYGAWLRRSRQPSRARSHLTNAEELFAALHAVPWLDRARAELRATGQPRSAVHASAPLSSAPHEVGPAQLAPQAEAVPHVAERSHDDRARVQGGGLFDELTAQEQLVAGLAAEGLSNRQIGERLFLSPRTVGSHLYKAFPKLGVSNRAQLRAALDRRRDTQPPT